MRIVCIFCKLCCTRLKIWCKKFVEKLKCCLKCGCCVCECECCEGCSEGLSECYGSRGCFGCFEWCKTCHFEGGGDTDLTVPFHLVNWYYLLAVIMVFIFWPITIICLVIYYLSYFTFSIVLAYKNHKNDCRFWINFFNSLCSAFAFGGYLFYFYYAVTVQFSFLGFLVFTALGLRLVFRGILVLWCFRGFIQKIKRKKVGFSYSDSFILIWHM
jgi:hypothetical protein